MQNLSKQLFERIKAAIAAGRLSTFEIAIEANLPPSTVYDMLRAGWQNRAVSNVEALAAAFDRLDKARARKRQKIRAPAKSPRRRRG